MGGTGMLQWAAVGCRVLQWATQWATRPQLARAGPQRPLVGSGYTTGNQPARRGSEAAQPEQGPGTPGGPWHLSPSSRTPLRACQPVGSPISTGKRARGGARWSGVWCGGGDALGADGWVKEGRRAVVPSGPRRARGLLAGHGYDDEGWDLLRSREAWPRGTGSQRGRGISMDGGMGWGMDGEPWGTAGRTKSPAASQRQQAAAGTAAANSARVQ
ncbi:hypothetical protein EDB80DRAFT_806345 [Ilyonectria destructans]|nr:hypothetical protein EDB80DRAFT_806345 [Ilyonectria destructans]